jgi:hypothetical protein
MNSTTTNWVPFRRTVVWYRHPKHKRELCREAYLSPSPAKQQKERFSAHRTLTTSPLSFPLPAQPALLRAVLVMLFFSPIGSLGCVCESQWVLAVHSVLRANQRKPTCCLRFPSCFLYNPKFQQAHRSACHLLHAGFLLGLFFEPEDGGAMFLRNLGWLSVDYTALYPRR